MAKTLENSAQNELFDGYTKAFDYDGSNNLIYSGRATIGSSKSSGAWQIKKFVYSGSNLVDILWAEQGGFSNIWDNRTSLSYS